MRSVKRLGQKRHLFRKTVSRSSNRIWWTRGVDVILHIATLFLKCKTNSSLWFNLTQSWNAKGKINLPFPPHSFILCVDITGALVFCSYILSNRILLQVTEVIYLCFSTELVNHISLPSCILGENKISCCWCVLCWKMCSGQHSLSWLVSRYVLFNEPCVFGGLKVIVQYTPM